uniref:Uncharacterized protein n=1 Tax=Daphnia galeata TaxID=27404 RepID=A0A8J2WNV3_9CRUS|nr:unnamed protein product [Daphnia galeata]
MRTITTILSDNSVYYTGVSARRLGRSDRQFVLQRFNPEAVRETLQVRISWDEYRDKIVDCGHIKIFAMAYVQETKRSWSEEDDFQLEKSKLDVQRSAENSQIGQDRFATFSFMNPISVTLTECEFTIEGPGLVRAQTVKYRDGKPREMISFASSFRDSAVSANWSHLSIPANWVTLSALARFMSVTEASSSNPAMDYTAETPSTLLRFGP